MCIYNIGVVGKVYVVTIRIIKCTPSTSMPLLSIVDYAEVSLDHQQIIFECFIPSVLSLNIKSSVGPLT